MAGRFSRRCREAGATVILFLAVGGSEPVFQQLPAQARLHSPVALTRFTRDNQCAAQETGTLMPPIRVCFMVMPFGTKDTGAEPGKGPAKIDFNALWDKALRPAIEDLGFLPVRADRDAGSLIIQAMIERLAISDLVIADVTIPNANVYYEVGVRHAAKKAGCVLIAADWSKPVFDIDQMRRLTYPMPEVLVTDDGAEAIRNKIKQEIRQVMDFVSPVYQTIPQFPGTVDINKVQIFHDVAERIARIQGEVTTARSLPSDQAPAAVQRLVDTYGDDAVAVPSVALDILLLMRDTLQWEAVLKFIDKLPDHVRQLPVVKEQKALALGDGGKPLEAIAELEALIRVEGDSSERRGLIGGRYKKLYDAAPDAQSKTSYLNNTISNYERGMMLDLNEYYPANNLPRLYRERKRAWRRHQGNDSSPAYRACLRAGPSAQSRRSLDSPDSAGCGIRRRRYPRGEEDSRRAQPGTVAALSNQVNHSRPAQIHVAIERDRRCLGAGGSAGRVPASARS